MSWLEKILAAAGGAACGERDGASALSQLQLSCQSKSNVIQEATCPHIQELKGNEQYKTNLETLNVSSFQRLSNLIKWIYCPSPVKYQIVVHELRKGKDS